MLTSGLSLLATSEVGSGELKFLNPIWQSATLFQKLYLLKSSKSLEVTVGLNKRI